MITDQLFRPDAIVPDLVGRDATAIFAELCAPLAASEDVPLDELVRGLAEREALASTAVGNGVAIPHGTHPRIRRIVTSFGRSRTGVELAAPDGAPVHLFVALLRPPEAAGAHLKAMARISGALGDEHVRAALLAAATIEDIERILADRLPRGRPQP
jgi:nitrogen PTS system EIIA component